MNAQLLKPHQAFQPGADLWIVPDVLESSFCTKLNWLLNFQLSLAGLHQKKKMSPVLKKICTDADFPIFSFENNDVMMIPTKNYFPNQYTLMIPTRNNLAVWTEKYLQSWRDLNSPSIRVFLPRLISYESYFDVFEKYPIKSKIAFVSEQGVPI